jgi:hypothetical protein
MRVLVAALLGGVIVFFWGFVSHMLLPLGHVGFERPAAEDPVIAAHAAQLPKPGLYVIPGLASEQMHDEAAMAAYEAKAAANPYALVIYRPDVRGMAMGPMLGVEAATNVVSALVVTWVIGVAGLGFRRRVAIATAMGGFAWLAVSVPYWNWYFFPLDFTLANLATNLVGWFLAGLGMAWWLGRQIVAAAPVKGG